VLVKIRSLGACRAHGQDTWLLGADGRLIRQAKEMSRDHNDTAGRLQVKNAEHELACRLDLHLGGTRPDGSPCIVITSSWVIDSGWVTRQWIPGLGRRIVMTCSCSSNRHVTRYSLEPDMGAPGVILRPPVRAVACGRRPAAPAGCAAASPRKRGSVRRPRAAGRGPPHRALATRRRDARPAADRRNRGGQAGVRAGRGLFAALPRSRSRGR
jgi:hypothetical protein